MAKDNLLEELRNIIMEGDEEGAKKAAQEWLEAGGDPMEAVEQGLRQALRTTGEKFERLEVFLPEMMMAAEKPSHRARW